MCINDNVAGVWSLRRPSRRVTAFTTTNMPFRKISRDVTLAAVNLYEHEHQNQCPPQSLSLHLCRDACSPWRACATPLDLNLGVGIRTQGRVEAF